MPPFKFERTFATIDLTENETILNNRKTEPSLLRRRKSSISTVLSTTIAQSGSNLISTPNGTPRTRKETETDHMKKRIPVDYIKRKFNLGKLEKNNLLASYKKNKFALAYCCFVREFGGKKGEVYRCIKCLPNEHPKHLVKEIYHGKRRANGIMTSRSGTSSFNKHVENKHPNVYARLAEFYKKAPGETATNEHSKPRVDPAGGTKRKRALSEKSKETLSKTSSHGNSKSKQKKFEENLVTFVTETMLPTASIIHSVAFRKLIRDLDSKIVIPSERMLSDIGKQKIKSIEESQRKQNERLHALRGLYAENTLCYLEILEGAMS
eukprot:snap_masked-scaffold_2-processed-gene-20.21-mRNA-1 protein AED:1.00 eAED:1.00 QI:0/0/0/0/1/1/2/0/322